MQRQQGSADLKEFAAAVKKSLEPAMKQARKDSNDALVAEVNKPELSDYFNHSKPSLSTSGICNTTEAVYLLSELRQRKEQMLNAIESGDDAEPAQSEKPRKVTDIRELPQLGKCEHSNTMNKYFIQFTGNMTQQGRALLRVSLIERIPGVKRMQNRATGQIEDVPSIKKRVKTMVVGAEQDNNRFEWQKINNEHALADLLESENGNHRIRFKDAPEYRKFARWNFSEKKK